MNVEMHDIIVYLHVCVCVGVVWMGSYPVGLSRLASMPIDCFIYAINGMDVWSHNVVCTNVRLLKCVNECVDVCMCECSCVSLFICMSVCIYLTISMHIWLTVGFYVWLHACVTLCMAVCTIAWIIKKRLCFTSSIHNLNTRRVLHVP